MSTATLTLLSGDIDNFILMSSVTSPLILDLDDDDVETRTLMEGAVLISMPTVLLIKLVGWARMMRYWFGILMVMV